MLCAFLQSCAGKLGSACWAGADLRSLAPGEKKGVRLGYVIRVVAFLSATDGSCAVF